MHILLVNDDGIGAVGIMALLRAAEKRGHRVTMCAPASQMSAASQRITLSEPIMVREYPVADSGCTAWSIAGTPADCVRVALCPGGLVTDPVDMVISGINKGENAGTAVYYSGTVSAAREASLLGIRAIAASILVGADPAYLDGLADFVIEVAERYQNAPFTPADVLNINAPRLPREKWAGVHYAPLSRAHFQDSYDRRHHPRAGSYFWLADTDFTAPPEEGSDLWYLQRGCTVLTLISTPTCAPESAFREMNLLG